MRRVRNSGCRTKGKKGMSKFEGVRNEGNHAEDVYTVKQWNRRGLETNVGARWEEF